MTTCVKSTTGRVAKRYSDSLEPNSSKRLARDSTSEPIEDTANNPFLVFDKDEVVKKHDSNAATKQTLDPTLQQYSGVMQQWKMLRDDNSPAERAFNFWFGSARNRVHLSMIKNILNTLKRD
ncbi:hypothetical protein G9A89_019658 [Geosiphon pyriformis]|nr:hypothetical protein G9A89_019658 [Geosiphon pyriformis]